jgi:hypothetical protein
MSLVTKSLHHFMVPHVPHNAKGAAKQDQFHDYVPAGDWFHDHVVQGQENCINSHTKQIQIGLLQRLGDKLLCLHTGHGSNTSTISRILL